MLMPSVAKLWCFLIFWSCILLKDLCIPLYFGNYENMMHMHCICRCSKMYFRVLFKQIHARDPVSIEEKLESKVFEGELVLRRAHKRV